MKINVVLGNPMGDQEKTVVLDTEDISTSIEEFNSQVDEVTGNGQGDWEIFDIEFEDVDGDTVDVKKIDIYKSYLENRGVEDFLDIVKEIEDFNYSEALKMQDVIIDNGMTDDLDDIPSILEESIVLWMDNPNNTEEFFYTFIDEIYGDFKTFFESNPEHNSYYLDGECIMKNWIDNDGEEEVRDQLGYDEDEELPSDIFDLYDSDEVVDMFSDWIIEDCFDKEMFVRDLSTESYVLKGDNFVIITNG